VQRVAQATGDHAVRARSEAIAFVIMACALVIAPMFAYPVFLMKALCFALFACAFNLLIGYVGLLSFGHALFFGWASYVGAHAAKVWGFSAGACDPVGNRNRRRSRRDRGCARDPPARHLFCHDHARVGADDVFLRHPSAVHAWRGRHPGGATRKAVRD
jgi:ABC-type branched-chain amino acid transport system, permease component